MVPPNAGAAPPGRAYNYNGCWLNFLGDHPSETGDGLPAISFGDDWRIQKLVAASSYHACVLLQRNATADRELRCWGDNSWGVLGVEADEYTDWNPISTLATRMRKVPLADSSSIQTISGGMNGTCAIFMNGSLRCWGYNESGAIGLGNDGSGHQVIIGDQVGEISNLTALDMGSGQRVLGVGNTDRSFCAHLEGGIVKCWGNYHLARPGTGSGDTIGNGPGEMGDELVSISVGEGFSVVDVVSANSARHAVRLYDATTHKTVIKIWGHNEEGALGQGSTRDFGYQVGETIDNLPPIDLGE